MTKIDGILAPENFERFLAGKGLKNGVTKIFEHGDRVHENKGVVVHGQDRERTELFRWSWVRGRRASTGCVDALAAGSQSSAVVPSPCLTVQDKSPAGLLGKAVHHGKAKAGAFAKPLGRKERLRRPAQRLFIHSFARIGHTEANVATGLQSDCCDRRQCFLPERPLRSRRHRAWRRGHSRRD